MKKVIKEFKEFAIRGNMLDLAIGVIIGAAFNKLITSIVNDLVTPFLSLITGTIDFANKSWVIGESVITYGAFIQAVIDFLLVAIVIFIIVKQINRFRRKGDPTTKVCQFCTRAIPIKATRCPECTSQLA